VTLTAGRVGLRPLRYTDGSSWRSIRRVNAEWLGPWEATPPRARAADVGFHSMVRYFRSEGRAGRMLPFVVTFDGDVVGQLTVGGISWGSLCSGHVGYWIDHRAAGKGIIPTAVALAVDHCFTTLGLHRIEVNIRPENVASLRVVEKLGFRDEGVRLRYLHIDGAWRDHRTFALTREEVPDGLLRRWSPSDG
jgi:ribosomal-protein-alanine N-acetyltransferase